MKTTYVQSVTSLPFLIFIIVDTGSYWLCKLSFVFDVDHSIMIDHIVVLFGFRHRPHRSNQLLLIGVIFRIGCTCMIDYVVVLSYFCHNLHSIQLVMLAQLRFFHRPHLYNQSRLYPLWFSSQLPQDPIGHDNSILVST